MREIKYIVIHCTGASAKQTVDSIKNYWKTVKKWKQVGYHHLVAADGLDNVLAPISAITNGVAGFNSNSIHLCYIGGENWKDTRTDAQKNTLARLVKLYSKQFPKAKIRGHRDFSPDKNGNGKIEPHEYMKVCPAFEVSTWLKEIGV